MNFDLFSNYEYIKEKENNEIIINIYDTEYYYHLYNYSLANNKDILF